MLERLRGTFASTQFRAQECGFGVKRIFRRTTGLVVRRFEFTFDGNAEEVLAQTDRTRMRKRTRIQARLNVGAFGGGGDRCRRI